MSLNGKRHLMAAADPEIIIQIDQSTPFWKKKKQNN
jgi:hypothetical protein